MDVKMPHYLRTLLDEFSFFLSDQQLTQPDSTNRYLSYLKWSFEEQVAVPTFDYFFKEFPDSSLEAIGSNCFRFSNYLSSISSDDKPGQSPVVKDYLENEQFREYCSNALSYLQDIAQKTLRSRPSTDDRTLKKRQEEYHGDTLQDIVLIYEMSQRTKTAAERALASAEKAEKQVIDARTAANGIVPNMLTILGVFIAIIIAVVACYLTLIFNQHQESPFPSLNISMCLLMGQLLMDIIFLLLYLISKLTNYTLACHCFVSRETDCSQCPDQFRNKCRLLNRIWLRYPYIVILNLIFVFSYFGLGLWGFLEIYLGNSISTILSASRTLVIGGAVGYIVLFSVICKTVFSRMRWKTSSREPLVERVKAKRDRKKEQKAQEKREKQVKKLKVKMLEQKIDVLTKRVDELEKGIVNTSSAQSDCDLTGKA